MLIKADTTLDRLRPGESAYIKKVLCKGRPFRHLSDMGLVAGAYVTHEKGRFAGDTIVIRLNGYSIAIRKNDGSLIEVTGVCHSIVYDFDMDCVFKPRFKKVIKREGYNFALAGVPNCGKTTLFNRITGENRKTGNFPGVTVEKKDAEVKGYPKSFITDLPGISSLSPYSAEETVARSFLLNNNIDCIINIVDATSPLRGLYLTMQLAELDIPMVIALNMMDEVHAAGGRADASELEKILGIPVVLVSASVGDGIAELLERAFSVAENGELPGRQNFYGKALNRKLTQLSEYIAKKACKCEMPVRFTATKAAEKDLIVLNELELSEDAVDRIIGADISENMAVIRYSFAEQVCGRVFFMPEKNLRHTLSVGADRLLAGKYTSLPIFAVIMILIFYITFSGVGKVLCQKSVYIVSRVSEVFGIWLTRCDVNPHVCSLVTDGIFAGIGCVIGFFPVIAILFFLLSVLEDCGYMARAALVTDKLLCGIGLTGKSFVPLFLGLGCSVPAIMAVKTLPFERDRRLTAMLIPFISCSAKLPIFLFLSTAFFEEYKAVLVAGLYCFGIISAAVFAVLHNKRIKESPALFVMELPDYRMPKLINTIRLMWDKSTDFMTRAFTVIFISSVVVWFLKEMSINLKPAVSADKSILAYVGGFAAPLFYPLGFGNWRAVAAVICGLAAKENIVSTLTVLSAVDVFCAESAVSFLVFCLLYTPCIAAVTTVKNEFGLKFALKLSVFQFFVAWVAAFVVKMFV